MGVCSETHYVVVVVVTIMSKTELYTALNVSRQYPLVLLVKASWKQGAALRSKEGKVMAVGLL